MIESLTIIIYVCRFIGEIFKQSLLSPYVIYYCVKTLISKTNERSLEYLCNLLKIAGNKLQEKVFYNFYLYIILSF